MGTSRGRKPTEVLDGHHTHGVNRLALAQTPGEPMNKQDEQIEQLRNLLLFSQTLLDQAIRGHIHDGWRLMAHQHGQDVKRHLDIKPPSTYLVSTAKVDDLEVLVEVWPNNECHVALRANSWETWPVGVWFTLEERNCG